MLDTFLTGRKQKNLFPNATDSCLGPYRKSGSSFSHCSGAGLWMQSPIFRPSCASQGTSARMILSPPIHANYRLLTNAEIQGPLHRVFPSFPESWSCSTLPVHRAVWLCVTEFPPFTLCKNHWCTAAIALWRFISPPCFSEDFDLALELTDFEGYQ